MKWQHWCGAAVLACLSAGCSTGVRPTQGGDGSVESQTWLQGRLLVRVAATAQRGSVNESLAFELRGSASEGELRLNSPFGPRLASARWSPGQALLNRADAAAEQSFSSLDDLSGQLLGEALPLAALPDWLRGRPWPGAPHQGLADQSSLDKGFQQLGWQVLLARRAQGWIEAQRDAAPAVLLRVKLDNNP